MVQFNLLPDVKINYIKTQRTKRMVMLTSITVTGLAIFILILLVLIVYVFQAKHLRDLNGDIQASITDLKNVPDLDKVLTIQNQLGDLTKLHADKPATSRIYSYLIQLTPRDAKIAAVKVDFDATTISIEGTANNLETVNRYADVLKFTTYKSGDESDKAFSEVVLNNFGVAQGAVTSKGAAAYSLQFKYNPIIFDNTKEVSLVVPNIISTRSVTERPTDLFESSSTTKSGSR